MPSEAMLLEADRDDLVQGVKWHGGFVRVSRRLGMLNYAATDLTDIYVAAKAFRAFAVADRSAVENVDQAKAERHKSFPTPLLTTKPDESKGDEGQRRRQYPGKKIQPELIDLPIMPTDSALVNARRHDMRWALRIHGRAQLAEVAGLIDPNAAHPDGRAAQKLRLDYSDARRYMHAQKPRLKSQRRYREWSQAGNRPWFLPADPKKYYSDRNVWVSWEDFLGVRLPGNLERVRQFRSYRDARSYMRGLRQSRNSRHTVTKTEDSMDGITSDPYAPAPSTSSGYKVWASSGTRPKDIPRDPVRVYSRRGEWVSWDDFLGRRKCKTRQKRRKVNVPEGERSSREDCDEGSSSSGEIV